MRTFPIICRGLFGLGLSLVASQARAGSCTSQFSGVIEPAFVAGFDYIDITGLSTVTTTSSFEDYRGESRCTNVINETINLPFYGRLTSIELVGNLSISGETPSAVVEILGSVTREGKSDEFHKTFAWTGVPPISLGSNGSEPIGKQTEANSVCGQSLQVRVDLLRQAFDSDPNNRGNVNLNAGNVRLKFKAVDPNDASCVNKPSSGLSSLPIPFANGKVVEIVSAHTHKCVDIGDFGMWSGAQAQQWDCAKSQNQLFRVGTSGDSLTLQALHSGQCLSIGNGSQNNGALSAQIADCASPAAKIKLGSASTGGAYTLRSESSGKCLDIDSGKGDNGQKLQQWECVGTKWQEWWINAQ